MKTNILPRQARDKHRENSTKDRFSSGYGTTQEPMNSTCHGVGDCKGLGWQEQHINGDIAMAFRLHWRATRNVTFLRESWPLINATAAFWASRFVRHAGSSGSSGGNWTVLGVVGPDEPSGVQDSEVYTNAIGAQTILFARDAAAVLGLPTLPQEWLSKAAAPYLPLVTSLVDSNGTAVHPEFEGYGGGPPDCCGGELLDGPSSSSSGAKPPPQQKGHCCIMQSAAALLQYPLGLPMATEIKINDLRYYEPRTRQNGFFTGDSIYSIAWLALGDTRAALTQWDAAFAHMDCEHFCLFREKISGAHSNFITGAGERAVSSGSSLASPHLLLLQRHTAALLRPPMHACLNVFHRSTRSRLPICFCRWLPAEHRPGLGWRSNRRGRYDAEPPNTAAHRDKRQAALVAVQGHLLQRAVRREGDSLHGC
jgi:hypothetical protein